MVDVKAEEAFGRRLGSRVPSSSSRHCIDTGAQPPVTCIRIQVGEIALSGMGSISKYTFVISYGTIST